MTQYKRPHQDKGSTLKFFKFNQNNSGGRFHIDDENGIGPDVWIEAHSADEANSIAESMGIYFDGIDDGRDCSCCGDRWYRVWNESGRDTPTIDSKYDFRWHDTVYIHRLDGSLERKRK